MFQVFEILHHEPVANLLGVFSQEGSVFRQGHSCLAVPDRKHQHEPHPSGTGKGIDQLHLYLVFAIIFPQSFDGNLRGFVCFGDSGRK